MEGILLSEPQVLKRRVVVPESAIKEMLSKVEVLSVPNSVIPENLQCEQVPEFNNDAVSKGIVIDVSQSYMNSVTDEPIKTINVDKCNVMLVKHGEPPRYDMYHNQNGNMDDNTNGFRLDDIRERYGDDAECIPVSSKKSLGVISTMRCLKSRGVTTTKRIEIDSGVKNISVVYRPKEDRIFVRQGENGDILVYDGFSNNK